MAYHLGYVVGMTYEEYFKKLGFTKDIKRVAQYKDVLQGKVSTSDICNLNRIIKYGLEKYLDKTVKIKVSRETEEAEVKILGFTAYGKVLLKDKKRKDFYLLGDPMEIKKIFESNVK